MRLIDADALKIKVLTTTFTEQNLWALNLLLSLIDEAPTIDPLKEQEPVEPIRQTEQTEWTVCGYCREHLISKWMFCPSCGRSVKWE